MDNSAATLSPFSSAGITPPAAYRLREGPARPGYNIDGTPLAAAAHVETLLGQVADWRRGFMPGV